MNKGTLRLIDWSVCGLLGLAGIILVIIVFGSVGMKSEVDAKAARTKALAHGKQIHLALAEFALDHDGAFPTAAADSNSAYRQLFDARFQDERIFFVPGCAWHSTLPEGQIKPDNDVGALPLFDQGLSKGENHWAYQNGLGNESNGKLPLVMDGFSDQPGVYADEPDERGGIWEGEVAVVVRVDGSGKLERLGKDFKVYEKKDGEPVNIFSEEYETKPEKLLNPL